MFYDGTRKRWLLNRGGHMVRLGCIINWHINHIEILPMSTYIFFFNFLTTISTFYFIPHIPRHFNNSLYLQTIFYFILVVLNLSSGSYLIEICNCIIKMLYVWPFPFKIKVFIFLFSNWTVSSVQRYEKTWQV